MKRSFVIACVAVMFVLAAAVGQAQTCTTTGATLSSPADNSTLVPDGTGAINFAWCNATADYFVIIETQPGAHDIVFGLFHVTTLALGPQCAPAPPIQCIPARGEHIFFTLDTVKNKQFVGTPQLYNFTAPGSGSVNPSPTTTTAANASATFSNSVQSVTLSATVTSAASTVNQGAVTFQVLDGATKVGTAVTSATLGAGSATATYLLPAGAAAKSYTIQATYSGGTNFNPSSGSGTLTVNASQAPVATTTTVTPLTVNSNSAAQNVTLTASVAAASTVNEGTVTFQVVDGVTNVGTGVTSATLSNGSASAIYALPAGLLAKAYTIQATYSGGTNFLTSSGSDVLTVSDVPPPTPADTATIVSDNAVTFSSGIQHVTLTAGIVPGDTVNEGTATFQVMDGVNPVGTAVPSAPVSAGNASVSYALPAATGAKTYTIQAAYSGGTNFLASNGTGTLTINKAQSTTTFTNTPPATLTQGQTHKPTATSTGDGALTIGASGACSVAGGVVTITATTGTCTVTATESDGPNFVGSSAADQTITVIADFSIPASLAPITLTAGQTGTTTVAITGQTGFTGTINFACTGLPAKSSCSFSPPAAGVVTVTVNTTASQTAKLEGAPGLNLWTTGGGIALAGVFLGGIAGKRRRWSMLLGLLVIAFLLTGVGCGGTTHNTIPGTPPGTSTVTVTGTSGPLTHGTSFTLNVQ